MIRRVRVLQVCSDIAKQQSAGWVGSGWKEVAPAAKELPAVLCRQCNRDWLHNSPWTQQWRHFSAPIATLVPRYCTSLNSLSPVSGSVKQRVRVGRGDGSGRGTYCGRGVKGQKARSGNRPHLLYDGGQKQLRKFPKLWATPQRPVVYDYVNLDTVSTWINQGKLEPQGLITMKDLRDSGAVSKTIRWGVKLLGRGASTFNHPVHLQVSACTEAARKAVERAGGSVTTVYYNPLGLRALLKPENFEEKGRPLPGPVRAWPPRENSRFDVIGGIPAVHAPAAAIAAAAAAAVPAPSADR